MVRIFHKVKHCTNGDVKCLANAFDNCANVDFGRLSEQFGGIEEVIITKLSISPKQSLHRRGCWCASLKNAQLQPNQV